MREWLFYKSMQWQWAKQTLRCVLGLHPWVKTLGIKYCKECGYHKGKYVS